MPSTPVGLTFTLPVAFASVATSPGSGKGACTVTVRTPNVLFLCTHNACRSQLAEAVVRQRFGGLLNLYSAGVEPGEVNPLARQVLEEIGVDTSGHRAKHVEELADVEFDLVVTVCDHAAEVCPVFPGETLVLHRSYRDPSKAEGTDEELLALFRATRDRMADELPKLIERQLGIGPPKASP